MFQEPRTYGIGIPSRPLYSYTYLSVGYRYTFGQNALFVAAGENYVSNPYNQQMGFARSHLFRAGYHYAIGKEWFKNVIGIEVYHDRFFSESEGLFQPYTNKVRAYGYGIIPQIGMDASFLKYFSARLTLGFPVATYTTKTHATWGFDDPGLNPSEGEVWFEESAMKATFGPSLEFSLGFRF